MKIGFIFECGKEKADIQVCRYLVQLLNQLFNSDIEFAAIGMDNKPNMIEQCGKVTKSLLESDRCEKVIIVWDLYPPWGDRKPCRYEDRQNIFNSLRTEHIDLSRVSLVCICEELEAWLLADNKAVKDMIAELKHPHKVGKIQNYKNPDSISNPKKRLTKIFNQELGSSRRYIDYQDAVKIVKKITDFNKIKNSESFRRFALKVSGIDL